MGNAAHCTPGPVMGRARAHGPVVGQEPAGAGAPGTASPSVFVRAG
jgi:hypothetical protein